MEVLLRIFRKQSPVTVLGPGARAVIWVQGCPFACPNCIVPESWDASGGEAVEVEALADWVLEQNHIEGVTLSGGEPMAQPAALTELLKRVSARSELSVVCYTGYTVEYLLKKGSDAQRALLGHVDLLIDGVYSEREHADLRWRGSQNQRLLALTDRYREVVESARGEADRSAGLELFLDENGKMGFAGVPALPGFRNEFEARLATMGIALRAEGTGE